MTQRESISFQHLFNEEIKSRYGQGAVSESLHGYTDAFLPYFIRANNRASYGHRTCISPNAAKMMGAKTELFSTVLKMVDIDIVRVRQNLEKIKRQNTELIQIGYGGFGINSLYFISEMAKICGIYHPFSKIVIYENDTFTAANAIRIFKDLSTITMNINQDDIRPISKLDLFCSEENLSSTIIKKPQYFEPNQIGRYKKRAFFIGAPDFQTRKILEECNFLFTGHSNNEVELFGRPVINEDIATETYGTINVFYFFLNILKASEMIIDVIANEEEIPKDKSIGLFNSEQYIKGTGGNSF